MGFRFRRSIRIAPGLRINLSKSGPSLSVGKRGATLNFGKRGERATVRLPGTGMSYSKQFSSRQIQGTRQSRSMLKFYVVLILMFSLLWLLAHISASVHPN